MAFMASLLMLANLPATNAFSLFGLGSSDNVDEDDTTVVDPVLYSVTFNQTGLNPDEEAAVKSASELIAGEASPVSGSLGLLVKAKSDRDLLIAALYEQARYSGLVRIYIEGKEISRIDPTTVFDTADRITVEIRVDGGKQFTFGTVRIVGDNGELTPETYGLIRGTPARSNLILEAQDDIVRQLNENGHPYAEVIGSDVEADHDTGVLDVTLEVLAGPTAIIGDATVTGNETVNTQFILDQADIIRGKSYSPEHIATLRRKLLELGVFSSVTVSTGGSINSAGEVPLTIEVTERKHRYFGVGATYSNTDGIGVEGYWGHRNLFGQAESLRIEGGVSRISETAEFSELNYNAAILFEKPYFYDPNSTFSAELRAVSENYDAFERRSIRGKVTVARVIDDRQKISAGVDLDVSRIEEANVETNHLIVSTPLEYSYDGSDDRFNPTMGSRVLLRVEPGHDFESGATFVKAEATLSAYHALSDTVVLAARTKAGTIVGAAVAEIPADRRFYAGGGGSVRGFEYQAIGPQTAGRPTGGLSLFEASLEARIKINEQLGIVPFVDAGSVSNSRSPDFSDVRVGAGVGVRYQTPFGPMRVDVGVPIDRRAGEDAWGVYAGIGQAF